MCKLSFKIDCLSFRTLTNGCYWLHFDKTLDLKYDQEIQPIKETLSGLCKRFEIKYLEDSKRQ